MPQVEEIHLVHHTHTDIGYTHDQPVVWDLQRRFIDEAIELVERDMDKDTLDAFKWTVEATGPLLHWLRSATETQIDRFRRLEDTGRIEVMGMLGNITPLYNTVELAESFEPLKTLRNTYELDIRHAMNCDVNGQNWPLVDIMLDADIEGFNMSINPYFGGVPLQFPDIFRWEGPSGRTIPTLNGYHYTIGRTIGIGRDAEEFSEVFWPMIERRLTQINYPLPALLIPCIHPYGDNGPPFEGFSSFIQSWNDRDEVVAGDRPRIRMTTPAEYWDVVKEHEDELPIHRGDWTDFWNFGSGSSAFETAQNRESRRRLQIADAMESILGVLGNRKSDRHPARRSELNARNQAWWDLQFYDEHTWGAEIAVSSHESEDVQNEWTHKASYAANASSLSKLLQRDGIAELARHIPTDNRGR